LRPLVACLGQIPGRGAAGQTRRGSTPAVVDPAELDAQRRSRGMPRPEGAYRWPRQATKTRARPVSPTYGVCLAHPVSRRHAAGAAGLEVSRRCRRGCRAPASDSSRKRGTARAGSGVWYLRRPGPGADAPPERGEALLLLRELPHGVPAGIASPNSRLVPRCRNPRHMEGVDVDAAHAVATVQRRSTAAPSPPGNVSCIPRPGH